MSIDPAAWDRDRENLFAAEARSLGHYLVEMGGQYHLVDPAGRLVGEGSDSDFAMMLKLDLIRHGCGNAEGSE
jgi:hypothetical protein